MTRSPRILLVGGFEPSGRVGLMADAEAVRRQAGTPLCVPTTLTAQGSGTFATAPVTERWLGQQLTAVLELGPVHAVKLGVVPNRVLLRRLRRELTGLEVPWVVDPVVRSSQGEVLSTLTRRDYLGMAHASVALTPNLLEAGWLQGGATPRNPGQMEQAARALLGEGFGTIVVKGGHLSGTPVDVAVWEKGSVRLVHRRRSRLNYRGTGCRFASMMATAMGKGMNWEKAARVAHRGMGALFRVQN